ncbi:MAG: hypothetical protein U0R17_02410 [Acidimicrobiia bacterium]
MVKTNTPGKIDYSQYSYVPHHANAALWLDAARIQVRSHAEGDPPFKGKGKNFDPEQTAVDNGIIGEELIHQIISDSTTITADQQKKFVHCLWVLNGKQHFPLVPIALEGVGVVVPPSFEIVAREYAAQLDEIERLAKGFFPHKDIGNTRIWNQDHLLLVFNPGIRVSPNEYASWLARRPKPGPSKLSWHNTIASSVQLPDPQAVFEAWNEKLARSYTQTPNGVLVKGEHGWTRRKRERLAAEQRLEEEAESQKPNLDIDLLFDEVSRLDIDERKKLLRIKPHNKKFHISAVNDVLSDLGIEPVYPDVDSMDNDGRAAAIADYKKEHNAYVVFVEEWIKSFELLDKLAGQKFNKDLSALHAGIRKGVVIRTLDILNEKRLDANKGSLEFVSLAKSRASRITVDKPIYSR